MKNVFAILITIATISLSNNSQAEGKTPITKAGWVKIESNIQEGCLEGLVNEVGVREDVATKVCACITKNTVAYIHRLKIVSYQELKAHRADISKFVEDNTLTCFSEVMSKE